ncbi:DUF3298 and DUF4163 domain-containing protein [Clostridium uliginosum]|uniref:Deacetylase PdaC domain-containing protein n=1 Tax=Clostridium uliginosum TaxID=119641 RepID=A0A1I1JJP6_9CLOT|nr:DUF3298 and DUF4163 domain-containing protein [Clostridium uliginosum]SFC48565.1 Protein of unknown function [Clostridium uliginosum]
MRKMTIQKLILSTLGIVLTTTLILGTVHTVNAASINDTNFKIQVVENSSNTSSEYFKENIKSLEFKNGNNEQKINLLNQKINEDITPLINQIKTISKEDFDMYGQEHPTFPYEINSDYKITNNSNSLLSLYRDFYSYTGGAHGNTLRSAYTIDKEKEELLYLNDLFAKGYDYKTIINGEISKQISITPENYSEGGKEFKGISDKQNFYIEEVTPIKEENVNKKDNLTKEYNLVIYFQQYEIAPYCFGIPEFKIPLNLFGDNFLYNQSLNNK